MIQFITERRINMLSYIELENFKSLTDFKIDFRSKGGVPKKLAFIYGENGSGKTNLVSAILFLSQSLHTLSNYLKLQDLSNNGMPDFISEIDEPEIREQIFKDLIGKKLPPLSSLIQENITIDCNDNMRLKIGFYIDEIEGSYELIFNDSSVVFEELRYIVNERVGVLYSISEQALKFSSALVLNSKYKSELKDKIKMYWGKHTFMSIIYNEIYAKNQTFINKSLGTSFAKVLSFFSTISLSCKNSWGDSIAISTPIKIVPNLVRGTVNYKEKKELLAMEVFLNSVFTQLYSDIKCVFYKFMKNDDVFSYELYVKKLIGSNTIEVPFVLESTGTQKLLEIVEFLLLSLLGSTVIVDEMDSDIHDLLIYELMEIFLEALPDSFASQFIATTHNTYLMEMENKVLPKESLYFITVDARGEKKALSLDDYGFRTQKNHNVRSKYLKGDYAGVPYTGYFDFSELVADLKEAIG